MAAKYDWPATDGLVALVKKHGIAGAARKLGVPRSSLSEYLVRENVPAEDRQQERQAMNADALEEIRELVS